MNTEKPNPHMGRPLKALIPEWLAIKVELRKLDSQREEIDKIRSDLYTKHSQVGEAIKKTAKVNQVFIVQNGQAIVVTQYGIEIATTTELIATVKKDR